MTKTRKYGYKIAHEDSVWNVQITRQITSKKIVVSKHQDNFTSEDEAKEWAEQQLIEFTTTQSTSNQRHDDQRKLGEQKRQQRSVRRTEKTLQAKQAEVEHNQELADKGV